MKEKFKNIIIFLLIFLATIFLVASLSCYQEAVKQKKLSSVEHHTRMVLEEKMSVLAKQNSALEQSIKQLKEALNKEKVNLQITIDSLNQKLLNLEKVQEATSQLEKSSE